jgi:hypothetical protein
MDVKDAKSKKLDLAVNIEHLISEFQKSTGCMIDSVEVINQSVIGEAIPTPVVILQARL